MSRPWVAQYRGSCAACEVRVQPGDEVRWVDGAVVHADCPEPADPLAAARPVCPRCFLEPSAAGTCGCDA